MKPPVEAPTSRARRPAGRSRARPARSPASARRARRRAARLDDRARVARHELARLVGARAVLAKPHLARHHRRGRALRDSNSPRSASRVSSRSLAIAAGVTPYVNLTHKPGRICSDAGVSRQTVNRFPTSYPSTFTAGSSCSSALALMASRSCWASHSAAIVSADGDRRPPRGPCAVTATDPGDAPPRRSAAHAAYDIALGRRPVFRSPRAALAVVDALLAPSSCRSIAGGDRARVSPSRRATARDAELSSVLLPDKGGIRPSGDRRAATDLRSRAHRSRLRAPLPRP